MALRPDHRTGQQYDLEGIEGLIHDRVVESEWLDYKADPHLWADPKSKPLARLQSIIAKAVSAFANRGGGTLLLGLDEGNDGEPNETSPPGLPSELDGMPAVERVDRMITRCVRPRPTTRLYPVPTRTEGRAYVVVEVLARSGGPHRVVATDDPSLDERYFVRLGRSSVAADHYQLRDLFADAAEGTMRVREYLARQGYGDPDASDFLRRPPAFQLADRNIGHRRGTGAVVLTLIPRVLRGDVVETDLIDTESEAIRRLIDPSGPSSRFGHQVRPTLHGLAVEEAEDPPLLRSFLHVHRNGLIAAGHSHGFLVTDHGSFVLADAIQAMAEPLFLVSRGLYEAARVADDVLIGVHLRDCESARLGLSESRSQAAGVGRADLANMTIEISARPDDLGTPALRGRLDRRVAHAFGVSDGLVLNLDGSPRPRFF